LTDISIIKSLKLKIMCHTFFHGSQMIEKGW